MPENDKQKRIIDAAYRVLAEKGYDKASTKEIAKEAGVAQGLIGYYFAHKDLLFAEVFRRESEKYCESVSFLHQQAKPAGASDTIAAALSLPKSRVEENPSWIRLRYELYALGLRNPAVADSIKQTLSSKRGHLSALIESVGGLSEEQAAKLAPILLSIFDGLSLQRLSDEQFDYDGAYETLMAILQTYIKSLKQSENESTS